VYDGNDISEKANIRKKLEITKSNSY